jgi:hypothetical protein
MGIRRASYRPVYQMPAYAMATPESNGAPLSRNLDIPVRLFDDTTSEKILGSFWLPNNYNASGNVIVTAAVEAATPTVANVAYSLSSKVIGDGSNIAVPWTTQGLIVSHAVDDSANTIHFHEQEYSYLPWSAGRLIIFSLGRNNLVDDNLVGDLRLYHLTIEVPVS